MRCAANASSHRTKFSVVILNLFKDNELPPRVILKQVQDDDSIYITSQLAPPECAEHTAQRADF
jgi:hypothetical protein